jgi:ubiquinol-cytochrome c reductase cytochrome b subunit
LEYAGWTVPKKMNRLGAIAPAIKGFFVPIERPSTPALPPAATPVSPAGPPQELEDAAKTRP